MLDILGLMSFGPGGWGKALLLASCVTLAVAFCGFMIGAVIGSLLAWGRIAGNRPVRALADVYTTVMRSIPELLVIYLFYFGGSMAFTALAEVMGGDGFYGVPPFVAGVIAIGVVSGAYQGEVYRGAFRAVARGEIEAATAFGMKRGHMFRRIIAPQVLRFALPGIGNIWQMALKESALISVTGLVELLRQAQIGAGSTRQPFEFYMIAGALYLLITWLSQHAFNWLERRSARGFGQAEGL